MNIAQKILKGTFDILTGLKKLGAETIFTGEKVSDDIKEIRLSTCESCSNFDKEERRCDICHCFMDIKTGLKTQLNLNGAYEVTHCPEGKWGEEDLEIANYYRKIKGEDPIKPNKNGLEKSSQF